MRISKPNEEENGLLTFENITLRDQAIESFKDGDMIKVLDASQDPEIKSGWAIYRFSIESETFDLVEMENPAIQPAFIPDGYTTTDGIKDSKGNIKIVAPDLIKWVKSDLKIDGEFELDFTFDGLKKLLRFTPKNIGNEWSFAFPLNSSYGLKYMFIGAGALSFDRFDKGVEFGHWTVYAQTKTTNEKQFASYQVVTAPDGSFRPPYITADGSGNVPIMVVRAKIPKEGQGWNSSEFHVWEIWKSYTKQVAAAAPKVELSALDNKTIILNSNDKIEAFHNLNHGAGFEFPSRINLQLNIDSDENLEFSWKGLRNGSDVFKYKGVQHPLGLRTNRIQFASLTKFSSAFGNTMYICFSVSVGYDYWSSKYEIMDEIPPLTEWEDGGRKYLPIAICKIVLDDNLKFELNDVQISHIYKNGLLVEDEPLAPEPYMSNLNDVLHEGNTSTMDIRLKRDGANSYGIVIEDEKGDIKHSQNLLGGSAQYELKGLDNSIGINLNGEGTIDVKKQVNTAALRLRTGAGINKVAFCDNTLGNVIWKDVNELPFPQTEYDYPDRQSCDYTVTNGAKHKFSVPDAFHGFRSDIRILKDFDFKPEIDYNKVNLGLLIGGNATSSASIPVMANDGANFLSLSNLALSIDTVNKGKTIYYAVCKKIYKAATNDAYYLMNTSSLDGVQVFADGFSEEYQVIMQVRIKVPLDWASFKYSDITIYKYWKKALGSFDELMDYRTANP